MKQLKLNIFSTPTLAWLIALVTTSALLLSSACTPPTPPPPPPPPNQPPIIESIIAEKEVPTLTENQVITTASDTDGDALTYQWSADGGTITGEGNSIVWTAPATSDNYTIKVMVLDGHGGTAAKSTTIAVIDKPNHPPVITGLTIDGAPPVKENMARQWVIKTIHCNAEDPDSDQLSYLWRATCGKIEGEGSTVTWIAPGVNSNCTIIVMVNDGKDGKADASIVFKVACCGGGF